MEQETILKRTNSKEAKKLINEFHEIDNTISYLEDKRDKLYQEFGKLTGKSLFDY